MEPSSKALPSQANGEAIRELPVEPRPLMVEGATYQTSTPVGQAFITINHNAQKEPFEAFITIGKSGSDVSAMAEALGRMISLTLRLQSTLPARERIRQVVAQLSGIGGTRSIGFGKEKVRSLPDAVAKILARHFNFAVNGQVEDVKVVTSGDGEDVLVLQQLSIGGGEVSLSSSTSLFDICPECGAGSLAYEEGCRKCYGCGYSEC